MEERDLRNFAVFVSVAGLALIFIASLYYEPARKPIYLIGDHLAGSYVETSGTVIGVRDANGVRVVELWNATSISVPLFFTSNPQVGDGLLVRGIVKNYKGSLEIVPSGERDVEIRQPKPRLTSIGRISDATLYEPIIVRGFISDVYPRGDFLAATLNDSTGTLRVILSERSVSKGDFVEVSGIVKKYYSSLELIPREIMQQGH